jgi:hypothetical protein
MPEPSQEPCYVPETPRVDRVLALIGELSRVPQQDLQYELRKLRGYRDALFEHFAPFKAGDRVRLCRDYIIDPKTTGGWVGYERMMSKGSTAVVREVDWIEGKDRGAFSIAVRFDREFRDSKLTGKTFEHPDDERRIFNFWDPARWWEVVSDT